MLRIHCMQHWYNLSDGAMEDACTKSPPCACLPDYPWIAPCRIAPPS
jgi:IS5 family transposase